MCGIAGQLRFQGIPDEADWEKISALMSRRGPDDSGLWAEDDVCTLVFRRLAILDLSPAGHQPMVSTDGRFVLVFNGEVYNFAELRRELVSRGIGFRSSGDSEVVLYALREWGLAALDKFNGMFALAFYDSRERRLLLARDHAGIKPLYYLKTSKGVVFASQYDQILVHPWSRGLQVSQAALGLYLRLGYIPAPYGALERTHMLEPGSWLEIACNGNVRQGQYYRFPRFQEPSLRGREAIDAVDAAVTSAVRRQLVSDVPLGAFLSGGIDSPLVVAKMLGGSDRDIQAFTIATGEDATDESEDAIAYARELGVSQSVEHVTTDRVAALLDDVINACGEPFGDYSIFPTMLVSQLASRDYKVMLSGDGGDELFWGYAGRSSALIQTSERFRSPHLVRTAAWVLRKVLGIGKGDFLSHHFADIGAWQKAKHSRLKEEFLGSVFPTLPDWPDDFQGYKYSGWKGDETAQWLRWNEFVYHLPGVLQKVDRASMYQSLEVRVPLLDREVVNTAAQVDWRSCLDPDEQRGKLPLRQSLARHVKHQTHSKRGFEAPMGTWLRTSFQDVFRENVLGKNSILGMEMNRREMSKLFDLHLGSTRDLARGLWPLLSLALWEKRYYSNRQFCQK